MSDPHQLLGAYAVDALPPDERVTFEQHLAVCETCRAELPGFLATAARLAETETQPVRPELRATVMALVSTTPQERPVVRPLGQQRSRRRLGVAPLVAAAASIVAVLAVIGLVVENDRAEQLAAQTERVSAVMTAPDAAESASELNGGGSLSVVSSVEHGAAVVMGHGLDPLDDKHTYQLWTMHDGEARPAGEIGRKSGMTFVADVGGADGIAVTVEPTGGSDRPTTDALGMARI